MRVTKLTRSGLALAGLVTLLAAGCVTTGTSFSLPMPWDKPDDRPSKIESFWDRSIRMAPNTKSIPMREEPCLAGRVYFFGGDPIKLITPRGLLVVDWYDMSGPPEGPHRLLGECVYTADDLQKVTKRDMIGIGYTVVAPWQTYEPKFTRVKVLLAFLPEKGGDPMYADPAIVSLQAEGPQVLMSQRQEMFVVPGNVPPPAKQ